MADHPELTVRELALAERVDTRTVRRWIATGKVVARRTPGGHLRIQRPEPRVVKRVLVEASPAVTEDELSTERAKELLRMHHARSGG